jgi:hypothetical protein
MTCQEYIAQEEESLQRWLVERPTADPALFWAGRMSRMIVMLSQGSALNISDTLEKALAVQCEYDTIVMSRVK